MENMGGDFGGFGVMGCHKNLSEFIGIYPNQSESIGINRSQSEPI